MNSKVGDIVKQFGELMAKGPFISLRKDGENLKKLGQKIIDKKELSSEEKIFLKEFVEELDENTVEPSFKEKVKELKEEFNKSKAH